MSRLISSLDLHRLVTYVTRAEVGTGIPYRSRGANLRTGGFSYEYFCRGYDLYRYCWILCTLGNPHSSHKIQFDIGAAEAVKEQAEQQRDEKESELNEVRALLVIEREQRIRAETTLEQERKSLIERKNTLDQAEQKLTFVFEGLASKVLASNTTSFLQLADATLRAGAVKDLQNLVRPLEQTLTQYQESIAAMERARQTAYGEITTTPTQVNATWRAAPFVAVAGRPPLAKASFLPNAVCLRGIAVEFALNRAPEQLTDSYIISV
jgi:hypothetical protein